MGLWALVTGKFRLRGMLSEDGGRDPLPDEPFKPKAPPPPRTGRVPPRPPDTPSAHIPESATTTAGTRSYGSQGGTPSTQRLHNPNHFR
jgi:hypothetical protein